MQKLYRAARKARTRAYERYSGFLVGAAIMTRGGRIFTGVNIEGVDYDVTHAEESAISAMRLATSDLPSMIVAVGGKADVHPQDAPIIPPCGKCRQKIYEWIIGDPEADIDVIVVKDGETMFCSIRELLPLSFGG